MQRVRQPWPVALVVLTALTGGASACLGGDDGASAPGTPTASPTAAPATTDPAPPVEPVAGERVPGAHWVDSSGLLTHARAEVGPADTVLPAVHAVGDWLDAHLDDLQRGGPGRLEDVAADGLLAAATDEELATVTSALASPDAPVASATYRIDASYAGSTEWLTATVEVVSGGGTTAAATMVFVPGDAGPMLVLFGPADPAGAAP